MRSDQFKKDFIFFKQKSQTTLSPYPPPAFLAICTICNAVCDFRHACLLLLGCRLYCMSVCWCFYFVTLPNQIGCRRTAGSTAPTVKTALWYTLMHWDWRRQCALPCFGSVRAAQVGQTGGLLVDHWFFWLVYFNPNSPNCFITADSINSQILLLSYYLIFE